MAHGCWQVDHMLNNQESQPQVQSIDREIHRQTGTVGKVAHTIYTVACRDSRQVKAPAPAHVTHRSHKNRSHLYGSHTHRDSDDALLADLLHRLCNQLTNLTLPVGADGAHLAVMAVGWLVN